MGKRVLTDAQLRVIARTYDGETETIDRLVRRFGCERHNITAAATRLGKVKRGRRKDWSEEEDDYLRRNWGRVSLAEMQAALGRGACSLQNRKKRLKLSSWDLEDYTIRDIEQATRIDHRLWHSFIEKGWVKAYEVAREGSAPPIVRVSVDSLKQFFTRHPEAFDYRGADKQVRAMLELNRLPSPPRHKLLTCRSNSWQDGRRLISNGYQVHHGAPDVRERDFRYSLSSCADEGGVDSWHPIYAQNPSCPRCGCLMSRFSEKAVFSDEDPEDMNNVGMVAAKLNLRYRNGRFLTTAGKPIENEELMRYVFSTKRSPSDAFRVFRRLLEAGVSTVPDNPVPASRLLAPILGYKLDRDQARALVSFRRSGNITVLWPPGFGKSYLAGALLTQLAGANGLPGARHVLFVPTCTLAEQWIEHFREHAPRITVRRVWNPYHLEVSVFEKDGTLRSVIEIYNYRTRHRFEQDRYVLAVYDESHFLPGTNAHRLAVVPAEYRVGLTASPVREDGRSDLIEILTGTGHGEDWQQYARRGRIRLTPVRVVVVSDIEQKFRALGVLVRRSERTLIFSDGIADGRRIAEELSVPFIHAGTRNRLATMRGERIVAVSRVGDCGVDLPDLRTVIEFSFHFGSRAQALQRYGRLLHSRSAASHIVLMTHRELSLYVKRLTALENKGVRLSIERMRFAKKRGRPSDVIGDPHWSRLLGLKQAA